MLLLKLAYKNLELEEKIFFSQSFYKKMKIFFIFLDPNSDLNILAKEKIITRYYFCQKFLSTQD